MSLILVTKFIYQGETSTTVNYIAQKTFMSGHKILTTYMYMEAVDSLYAFPGNTIYNNLDNCGLFITIYSYHYSYNCTITHIQHQVPVVFLQYTSSGGSIQSQQGFTSQ